MIYIENNTKSIQIPRHYTKVMGGEFLFNLYHLTTCSTYSFNVVDNKEFDLIYEFHNLDFNNLPSGEFEFTLSTLDGLVVLESGVLQIGEYKNTNKQYGKKQNSGNAVRGKTYEG